jgi:hypothetical protein
MMQDPMVMGQIGQNPMAQQMQGAIMAHIAEHVAFQYRAQVEKRLGVTLPAPNTEMPEEVEVQLSKLVAQASTQLLQMHQGEAAQKQALQQAQDPIIQMQQQELQIKQAELDIKAKKLAADSAAKADQLQIERDRIKSQEMIAGMNAQVKVDQENKGRLAKEQEIGAKLGIDLAKSKAQMMRQQTPKKGENT